jgi:hypothetical protein
MADKKKSFSQKEVKQYIDLLYMTPEKVAAKDIAAIFNNTDGLTVELWAEMNVMELVLPNENSVDFEPVEVAFKNPSDAAFVKNRGITTIFALNLCEADLPTMTPYLEELVSKLSGFVCADSEDFSPVYAGSSKR